MGLIDSTAPEPMTIVQSVGSEEIVAMLPVTEYSAVPMARFGSITDVVVPGKGLPAIGTPSRSTSIWS